jgi:hypothetical protein
MARMNWDRVQREERLMRWLRSGERHSDDTPGDATSTAKEPLRSSGQRPDAAPVGRFTTLLERGEADLSPVSMASWIELSTQLMDVVDRLHDGDGLLLAGARPTQELLLYRRGREIRVRVFPSAEYRFSYLRLGMSLPSRPRFGDLAILERTFACGQCIAVSRHIVAIIQGTWTIREPGVLRYLKVLGFRDQPDC